MPGGRFFRQQRLPDLVRSGKGVPVVSLSDGFRVRVVGRAAEENARLGQMITVKG
ncbi:flagella basal body P-ring formation protein FlgA [Aliiroseovarius sp.]|uniref:flagella basal body P-ring formation protein FlgA n=1 Tax=Aliiroseovarius sp. TaxID=1872442 RepID=UPI00342AE649